MSGSQERLGEGLEIKLGVGVDRKMGVESWMESGK